MSDAKVKQEGTPSPDGVDISYSSGKPDAYKEVLQALQATFNKANAEWKPEYDASGKLVTARPVDRVAQFAETWDFNASSQTLNRPASTVSDLAARQDLAKLQHPDLGTIESKNPAWVNVLGNIFTLGIYGLTYSALEKGRQQPLVNWQSGALEARGRATGTADMKTEELNLAIADAGLGVALGVVGLGAGLLEEGLAAAGAEASRLGAGSVVGEIGEVEGFSADQAGEQLTGAGVFRADGNLGAIAPGADPAAFDPASWYAGLEAKPLAGGAAEKVWTDPVSKQDFLVLKKPGTAADGTATTEYVLAKADGGEVRLYDPQTQQTGPVLARAEGGWRVSEIQPAPASEIEPAPPADLREAAAEDGFTPTTIDRATWQGGVPVGPPSLSIRSVKLDGRDVQFALVDGEYTAVKPRYAGSNRFYQLYDPRTDQSWGDLFVGERGGKSELMASRPGFDGRLRGGMRPAAAEGEADPLLANSNVGVPVNAPAGNQGIWANIRRGVWNPGRQPYVISGNGLAVSNTGPTIELAGAVNPARAGLAGAELRAQAFEAGSVFNKGANGSWQSAIKLDGITDPALKGSLSRLVGQMGDAQLERVGASMELRASTGEAYRLIRTGDNQIALAKPLEVNGRAVPNSYAVMDSNGNATGRQFYVGPTQKGGQVADQAIPFEELSARAQQQLLTGDGRVQMENGRIINLNDYSWRGDAGARANEYIASTPARTDLYDIPGPNGSFERNTVRTREETLDRGELDAKLAFIQDPTPENLRELGRAVDFNIWRTGAQGTARASRFYQDNVVDARATGAKAATVRFGITAAIGTTALIAAGIYARNLINRSQSAGGAPAGTPVNGDTYEIPAGSAAPLTADVLANDQAGLTVRSARLTVGQGTVAVVNNQVTYTPPAGGLQPGATVTVEYVAVDAQGTRSPATLTINADPRATLPDTAAIPAGSTVPRPIDVLANDPQAALTLTSAQVVSGGGTAAVQNGQLVYTPPAGGLQAGGVATLSYTATDPQGRTSFNTVQVRADP